MRFKFEGPRCLFPCTDSQFLHSKAVSWNGALRPWQPMKRATSGSLVKRGCAGAMLTYEDKRCGTTMKRISGCGKEQSLLKRFIEMFTNIPHSGETSQMIQRRTVTSVQLLHRLARLFRSRWWSCWPSGTNDVINSDGWEWDIQIYLMLIHSKFAILNSLISLDCIGISSSSQND